MAIKQGQISSKACCPQCRRTLDGFTSLEGATPSAGDITICVYCDATLEFVSILGELQLQPVTPDNLAETDFVALARARGAAHAMYQRIKENNEDDDE